jgi:hypothetical protein
MSHTNRFDRAGTRGKQRRMAAFHRQRLLDLQEMRFAFANGEATQRQLTAAKREAENTARARLQVLAKSR